nr:ribonuclease H-like domain-containing protein [Tanacetum cinerariifolium]
KRQDTLSLSSAEAEYRGVANAVAETSWIPNLLRELDTPLFTATLVYCDNVSAVYMSANPLQHQRTKHIEIDIHFVRDKVAAGHVRVLHVPSRFQYTYIFTKGPVVFRFQIQFERLQNSRSNCGDQACEICYGMVELGEVTAAIAAAFFVVVSGILASATFAVAVVHVETVRPKNFRKWDIWQGIEFSQSKLQARVAVSSLKLCLFLIFSYILLEI